MLTSIALWMMTCIDQCVNLGGAGVGGADDGR